MEVNSVGPVAGPAPRFSATEHAARLAEANQQAQVKNPAPSNDVHGEIAQRVVYLPAAYAAAAHAQLAIQATAFAAQHPVTDGKATKHDEIPAVEGVEGGHVSTVGK